MTGALAGASFARTEAAKMCRDIATAIEQSLTYPGEVKVTVLRETKVVEYAK